MPRWSLPQSARCAVVLLLLVALLPTVQAAQRRLNDPLQLNGDVQSSYQISPDGSRVVYLADQDADEVYELYSVPVGAPLSAATRLSRNLATGGDVSASFQFSPDGNRVVYHADQEADNVYELYSVPLAGPATAGVKLNRPLATGGNVDFSFQISPDGSRIVYLADQEADGVFELYSVPLAGPATDGVKLNRPFVSGGDVSAALQFSPDGSRVVYLADQEVDGVIELYSVPLVGPATAGIKLNRPLVSGGDVLSSFQFSPDGNRVVYHADQEADNVYELYSVPLAGPADAGVKLNRPLVSGGTVSTSFQFSPDGSWVVYLAIQEAVGVFELYSVPLAGPATAGVKLNRALVSGGTVLVYQISPDGSRVVYLADQEANDVVELYSVPLAGPATAGVKLNRALVSGGDVSPSFQISPDGSRVVYPADQEANDVVELYSVPLAGPADAGVKLNHALVSGGNVSSFQISPDGSRVVYRADQEADEVIELYSVPLAGLADAGVKLNRPLVSGGDVLSFFQFSPDGSRVVYLADQEADEVLELYSVPLAGPATAGVKLNRALVIGGDVSISYQISPDGSRVVYRADQEADDVFELFVADATARTLAFAAPTAATPEAAIAVTLLVRLNEPSVGTISVGYRADGGSATAGSDYTFTNGSLTFAPGQTEQTITVTILDDDVVEAEETLSVVLESPTDGATLASPGTVIITIGASDQATATPSATATSPAATATPSTTSVSSTTIPGGDRVYLPLIVH